MEIKSTETIKQAVMAGMGVSFLSAHTISRELQAGSLAVLNVQGFPLMLNWYVVHRTAASACRRWRRPSGASCSTDGAALIEQTVGPARGQRPALRSGNSQAALAREVAGAHLLAAFGPQLQHLDLPALRVDHDRRGR